MGYFVENPINMDDLGVPPFQETSILAFLVGDKKKVPSDNLT